MKNKSDRWGFCTTEGNKHRFSQTNLTWIYFVSPRQSILARPREQGVWFRFLFFFCFFFRTPQSQRKSDPPPLPPVSCATAAFIAGVSGAFLIFSISADSLSTPCLWFSSMDVSLGCGCSSDRRGHRMYIWRPIGTGRKTQ